MRNNSNEVEYEEVNYIYQEHTSTYKQKITISQMLYEN